MGFTGLKAMLRRNGETIKSKIEKVLLIPTLAAFLVVN